MNTYGFTIEFQSVAVTLTPELLDDFYTALAGYYDFNSVDMVLVSDNEFHVLIGITAPNGYDAEFADGIVTDALDKAAKKIGLPLPSGNTSTLEYA